MSRSRLAILILLCMGAGGGMHAAQVDDPRFVVFSRAASLGFEPLLVHLFADDAMLRRIDSLEETDSIRLDLDGDGATDALAWREGSIRVAALAPDLDRDPQARRPAGPAVCYLADGNSDGAPERIVEWFDRDGDGRADRQDIYDLSPGAFGTPGIGVTVFIDMDGTNGLLHTTGYSFHSNRDVWRSDFDGNLCLIAGWRNDETGEWVSAFENPFCFYDNDGDGNSDEAVRLEGENLEFTTLRWSFDADGDARQTGSYDYDFSLTAVGRVRAPEAFADSVTLRDGRALRFVRWDRARDLARWGLWRSALLVWDEEDRNVDPLEPDHERWEGVIADPFLGFPQVGGPGCGRTNKRYELDWDGSGRLGLYRSEIDGRIHLLGAERGEISIHLPGDLGVERVVRMADSSGNGFFDSWSYTMAAGRVRKARFYDERVRLVPLDAKEIRSSWSRELPRARDRIQWDSRQLESSIQWKEPNEVRRFLIDARDRNDPWIVRASRSLETDRYLKEIGLWEMGGGFLAVDSGEGDRAPALAVERSEPRGSWEVGADAIPEDLRRDLRVSTIVEAASGGIRIRGQGDDLDGDGRVDAIFVPATEGSAIDLIFDPPAPMPLVDELRVDPYFGAGIAFESPSIGWRTYEGRLDLFLKRKPRLILRGPLGDYHAPQDWGMDALDVGAGPGVGGIYAREGDAWIPCFAPGRPVAQRVAADGPARAVVEAILELGGDRIRRQWSLECGSSVLMERVEILSGPERELAAALPAAEEWGELEGGAAIWSFGPSAQGAGGVGLAGALVGGDEARIESIDGMPAVVFRAAPGRPIELAWTAGGEIAGDATARDWREAARARLSMHLGESGRPGR